MSTITLKRGEAVSIRFTITDADNGLAGKRVTWALSESRLVGGSYLIYPPGNRVLRKVSGLPGSSADVTITTQTAGEITGTINLYTSDYVFLPKSVYVASLWVDDGAGVDRCVTEPSIDTVVIADTVARTA